MTTKHTALVDQSALVSMIDSSISWAQLEPGTMDIAYRVVAYGPIVLSQRIVNLACQINADVKSDIAAVASVESHRPGTRWLGQEVDSEALAVCRDELDLRLSGLSTVEAVAVNEKTLHAHYPDSLDAAEVIEHLKHRRAFRNPASAVRFRRAIRTAFSQSPPAERTITGTIVPLLATTLESSNAYSVKRTDTARRRFSAVRACERHMRENICNRVTLLDLSRVCGMRTRSLITAFETITGLSPMEYLKRLRLTEVRRTLLRANPKSARIIDVATEWGFWHMGHFSSDYRSLFGEAPRQTLLTRD